MSGIGQPISCFRSDETFWYALSSVGGEPRQVLLELGVVVDLEVRALVDAPREVVVLDLVLAVVGDELGAAARHGAERQEQGSGRAASRVARGVVVMGFLLEQDARAADLLGRDHPRKLGSSRSMSSKYEESGETFWSSP